MLDGGALLQWIPWARGTTYKEICHVYRGYVSKKYGEAVVVFDGYEGKSMKDMTHQRRTKGQAGETVTFTSDMQLTMKKDQFLVNKTNKQLFINMLGDHLEMSKCEVHHAPGDADLLIVQKAVESATKVNTVLVGDDTDLLIFAVLSCKVGLPQSIFQARAKEGNQEPQSVGHYGCQETARSRDMHSQPLSICSPWMRYNLSPPWHWEGKLTQEIPVKPTLS